MKKRTYEASNPAKRQICTVLKELMTQKPLNRITVAEIMRGCGMARQHFYYHFDDVYDAVRWIFEEEAVALLREHEGVMLWQDGLLQLFQYLFGFGSTCRDDHFVGRDDQVSVVLLGSGHQMPGVIRVKVVVTVHKLDVFAVGQRNALIAGIRCAGVGFIHQCNAVVAGGKGAADGKGVVGGAIVQQQDLNAFISLGADAFDTAGNAPGSVVHGHDDAYKGKFHRFSFSQMRLWVRANASESFCTGPLGRGLSNRLR